jgi:putative addiction module killer protein/probable addiction module antidote protein
VIELVKTDIFDTWLDALRDKQAKRRIEARLFRLESGNPGDSKPVGDGVSEMRVDYGPGYRVYYVQRGQTLIVLLCGGGKSSQARDIISAKSLASQWKGSEMPGVTFSRFDVADYLEDQEDYAGFLQAIIEGSAGDPAEVARALGAIARARAVSELAQKIGMSRKALVKTLSGEDIPPPETVARVAAALGVTMEPTTTA